MATAFQQGSRRSSAYRGAAKKPLLRVGLQVWRLRPRTREECQGARGHACLMLDSLLLRYSALKMSWELVLVIVKVRRHDARTPGICHERVDK
jgi:hypothetical protein